MERGKVSTQERLRDPKTSVGQMEKMLQFMMENPEFAHGKLGGRTLGQSLWEELADILNSDKSGPMKPIHKWQKSWVDWKCNTKRKYARMKSHRVENDEEHANLVSINKLEEKLLAFILPESVNDHDFISREADPQPMNELPSTSYAFTEEFILPPSDPVLDAGAPVEEKTQKPGVGREVVKGLLSSQRKRLKIEEKKLIMDAKRFRLEERGQLLKERMFEEYKKRNKILEETLVEEKRRTDIMQSVAISLIQFLDKNKLQ
ncbi:uncharacterized protein LOC124162143 [Ischnura elegans]|uniref:uncharacterized protein LOC124162143 n=1 Tax=Ischnura elegans TaxID=197161 RepID=UPI001ED86F2B|nr:uncharacterized protein LOC124162143 [Ischnura elegans]